MPNGLCVSAAVLYQLSYEDPYIGSGPIWGDRLNRERNKTLHEGNVNCRKTSVNLRYDRHGCYNNFSKQLQEWPKEISGFKRDSSPLPAR